MAHFGCPHCKSEMLDGLRSAVVSTPVYDWNEYGEPQYGPTSESRVVELESGDDLAFRCRTCGKEFPEAIELDAPTDSIV